MIKELKEEIKFVIENPILVLGFIGLFSGFIPALIVAVIDKLF